MCFLEFRLRTKTLPLGLRFIDVVNVMLRGLGQETLTDRRQWSLGPCWLTKQPFLGAPLLLENRPRFRGLPFRSIPQVLTTESLSNSSTRWVDPPIMIRAIGGLEHRPSPFGLYEVISVSSTVVDMVCTRTATACFCPICAPGDNGVGCDFV